MKRKSNQKNEMPQNLIDIESALEPLFNYLISIENIPIDENLNTIRITIGVPINWIMETDRISTKIVKNNGHLKLITIEPILENGENINSFYGYVIELINKNLQIDNKRVELENQINLLKSKFEEEQNELINDLYNKNEDLDGNGQEEEFDGDDQ